MPSRRHGVEPPPAIGALDGPEPCLADADPCVRAAAGTGPALSVCAGEVRELTGLDADERMLLLAALTARFSAGFLRWMRSRPGDALTYSNVRVLEILEAGGPTIMRDIASSLGMTARNMTAIVDALEESGLVRRTPHPHDRRATVIELTDEGGKEAARVRTDAVAWVAEAFNSLTAEEQQQYVTLLNRLSDHFCA